MRTAFLIDLPLVVLLFALAAHAAAQSGPNELKNAEALLEWLQQAPESQSEETDQDQNVQSSAIKAFEREAGNLNDEQLATRWVALLKTALEDEAKAADEGEVFGFHMHDEEEEHSQIVKVIQVLPHPRSWDAIRKELYQLADTVAAQKAVRAFALRLLGDVLSGDYADAHSHLQALQKEIAASSEPMEHRGLFYVLPELHEFIMFARRDIEAFKQDIDHRIKEYELAAKMEMEDDYDDDLELPDIVMLLGEEEATPLLKRALALNVPVELKSGTPTYRLAQKLALQEIDNAKAPSWQLCEDFGATALFEAYYERFPQTEQKLDQAVQGIQMTPEMLRAVQSMKDESRWRSRHNEAIHYYWIGLVLQRKPDKATRFIADQNVLGGEEDGLNYRLLSGQKIPPRHYSKIYRFLSDLLTAHPEYDLWSSFIHFAALINNPQAALDLLDRKLADDTLDQPVRRSLLSVKINALLAAGQLETAIGHIRKTLGTAKGETRTRAIEQLIELGVATENKALAMEGLALMGEQLDSDPRSGWRYDRTQLIAAYIKLGELDQAYEMTSRSLKSELHGGESSDMYPSMGGHGESVEFLELLVAIYVEQERYDDVIYLLDHAPWWGVKDAAQWISLHQPWHYGWRSSSDGSFVRHVALAFHKTGKSDVALRLMDARMSDDQSDDDDYRLLLSIGPDNLVERLDRLASLDRFEERPLIWKAHVLCEKGQLEDALSIVKQAIAIDPSDGEQPKGRRMHAYAVLADILGQMNQKEDEALYRKVVRAIRMSERADELASAGLATDAINLYRQSLNLFSDAYCIQSRIALKLASQGDMKAAADHYRRAFELMPDSFGQIESHCFGCEGVFAGQYAQQIATEVFADRVSKSPDNPQVYYLLGLLQEEQNKMEQAVGNFQKAVSLDPDYFNAWDKLLDLSSTFYVSSEVANDAAANLIRLDPLARRFGHYSLVRMTDLKKLWLLYDQLEAPQIEQPESIYPLAAATRLADQYQSMAGDQFMFEPDYDGDDDGPATPGKAVAQHQAIGVIAQLLAYSQEP